MTVVTVLVGVLVAIAAPSYQRAIQQSRVDVAAANLRAIWAAERLFWLQNQTYTSDLSQLQSLRLLDPRMPTADRTDGSKYWDTYFWYNLSTSGDGSTFAAHANASMYTGSLSTLSIDQTGQLNGNVTVSGSRVITPIDFW